MTDSRPFVAVALAGGSLEADFRAAGYDVPNKAYLRLGGQTMLERVLRALRGSRCVGTIRCVTQREAFAAAFGDERSLCDDVVEPGRDLIDSLIAGFAGLPETQMVLVAATDIPLVTSGALDAFGDRAAALDCDLGYGCVRKEPHMKKYPRIRHTWVRLRDGTFCGAGVSVVRAGSAARVASILRDFAAARKSPMRLASLLSPQLVWRFLMGRVGIAELEQSADELTGLRCRGIPCDEPELAVNVDEFGDLKSVLAIVNGS